MVWKTYDVIHEPLVGILFLNRFRNLWGIGFEINIHFLLLFLHHFHFFLFKTKLTNNFIKHLFFGGHTKLYFPASLMIRSHAMSANGFLSLHGFLLFFLFFFLTFWLENSLSTDWEGQVSAAQNWKARRVEKRSKIGWKMFEYQS